MGSWTHRRLPRPQSASLHLIDFTDCMNGERTAVHTPSFFLLALQTSSVDRRRPDPGSGSGSGDRGRRPPPRGPRDALGALSAAELEEWLVANLHLKSRPREGSFPMSWDNVIHDSRSLGYVVATHQSGQDQGPTVLTWYYPYSDDEPRGIGPACEDGVDRLRRVRRAIACIVARAIVEPHERCGDVHHVEISKPLLCHCSSRAVDCARFETGLFVKSSSRRCSNRLSCSSTFHRCELFAR